MKIKIYADIPCSVFLNGAQYVTPFTLETKPSEYAQMSVLPSSPEKYASYTLTFSVEEDRLKDLSGGAKGISWGAGLSEIKLEPPYVQERLMPEIISQKKVNGSQITLYTDGSPKIMCEGRAFFVRELPRFLKDSSMRLRTHPNGLICAVEGKVEDKNYLLALSLSESTGEWEIMHELTADNIETTEKGVRCIDILPSMLRHEKRSFYKPFCQRCENISFTPTVYHEYKKELIPYLFLECISMGNVDAESYLDSSLGIGFEEASEFFGEFDTITSVPFGDYSEDVIAVFDSKKRIARPDLYKIESNNSKITNIIHLLTCY